MNNDKELFKINMINQLKDKTSVFYDFIFNYNRGINRGKPMIFRNSELGLYFKLSVDKDSNIMLVDFIDEDNEIGIENSFVNGDYCIDISEAYFFEDLYRYSERITITDDDIVFEAILESVWTSGHNEYTRTWEPTDDVDYNYSIRLSELTLMTINKFISELKKGYPNHFNFICPYLIQESDIDAIARIKNPVFTKKYKEELISLFKVTKKMHFESTLIRILAKLKYSIETGKIDEIQKNPS